VLIATRISVAIVGVVFLAVGALSQAQPLKVKGHELAESAQQFFAEGHEKQALDACATGDFKTIDKPSRRVLKQYCSQLSDARQQAISGNRTEYKGDGDRNEMRTDTFTFDHDRLVRVQLVFAAPSPEENYRGQTFAQIFAGMKQAYGPPTSEHTEPVQDPFGVASLAHRELWELPQAVILITEQAPRWPEDGSTTLTVFTRAEYDRSTTPGIQPNPNPLR